MVCAEPFAQLLDYIQAQVTRGSRFGSLAELHFHHPCFEFRNRFLTFATAVCYLLPLPLLIILATVSHHLTKPCVLQTALKSTSCQVSEARGPRNRGVP